MQLNMTECNYLSDSDLFIRTILKYKSVLSYVEALFIFDDDNEPVTDVPNDLYIPMDFSVKFDGQRYPIMNGYKLTDEACDALDDMFAYSKNSNTFDFIQDDIKIDVDIFEKELYIEIEEK